MNGENSQQGRFSHQKFLVQKMKYAKESIVEGTSYALCPQQKEKGKRTH